MNRIKTAMLLALLTALLLTMGLVIGGKMGLIIALTLALLMNFGAYWFSDRIVLRMYNAQELTEDEDPEIFEIVRDLTRKADMPMPKLYLIEEEAPNAFATGRNPKHAAVAVTTGLLELLDEEELAGVIAHELAHVKNRDTLVMSVTATIAGALGMLANFGLFFGASDDDDSPNPVVALLGVIIAPIAAGLIQMAISRSREFMADETGARLTTNPMALANALYKIENWSKQVVMQQGSPATGHMFIINPFSGAKLASLFSTHPATEARIERLELLARTM
jgi:heat shock protein HtpX